MESHRHNPEEFYDENTLVIADITDAAKAKAADVALEKSTESTEKPKGFWNTLKSIGKNIWKRSEIYQTKERHNALKKIKESGNIFAHEGADKQAHEKETGAIVKRFTAKREFEGDLIHQAAGESKTDLGNSQADQHLKSEINNLIRDYAKTGDEGAFYAGRAEVLDRYGGKGKFYADNIFKFAQKARDYVKLQVDQQVSEAKALVGLDSNFKIVTAKAKAGVRSEAQFNAVDSIVDKFQHWTGGVINEKTVAVVVATANTVFSKVVQGAVKRAAGFLGLGAVVSGAAGAARESRKIEIERMQHAREKAQGKTVKNPALAKRREELEASRIQTKTAQDLERGLNSNLFDKLVTREAKDLTEGEYREALVALADLKSRVTISDTGIVENPKTNKWQFWRSNKAKKVDLISYSDITKVDQDRNHLNMLVCEARTELKKWADAHGKNFKNDLQAKLDGASRDLWQSEKGINKQNEIFRKLKTQKVKKAFWKGTLIGGAIGLAVQEAHAFIDANQEGIIEHFVKGSHSHLPGERATLAEGLRRRAVELFEHPDHNTTFVNLHDQQPFLGGHNFELPEGYVMQSDGHGGYQILDHGRAITDSFKLNPDGTLTPDAKRYLIEHHFGPHEDYGHGATPDRHLVEPGSHMALAETKTTFPGLAEHKRIDWHDNPGQHWSNFHHKLIEFEGKQQNVYLEQGADGTVYVDGRVILKNLIMNLREHLDDPNFGVNPDGSFDQKLIDLKDHLQEWVKDGTLQDHMQVAIIPTDAANHAGLSRLIEGAVGGKIALPPEYSAMFTDPSMLHDGHLPFKFLEWRIDGHTIATANGGDIMTSSHDVLVPGAAGLTSTVIGHPENPTDYITQPPYIIPYGRRPGLEEMERVILEPPPPPEYTSLSYGRISPEQMKRYKERMSARLRDNPDADLDHYEELEDYFHRMDSDRFLRTRMLAGQGGKMNKDVTISVNIPVAGHQEGDNIYKSLQNYTNQTIDLSKFEISLFVNHPDVDREGNIVKPDKTLSEIERFKKDYPNFNVKVMYQILPREEAKIGNIRKYLNDAVLLRHHQRGQDVPDLIMVSNDADNKGMATEYLQNFCDKFEQNPMVDAFLGQMDWDPEAYINNPLMHIGTRFFQYVDSQTRRRDVTKMQSSGANFALRSSIYAAVDGYDDTDVMAEDVVLGSMIKTARYGARNPARVGIKFAGARVSRMYTNARRGLIALENGLSPIEQWQRGFSAFDNEVRSYKMAEGGLDFDDPAKCQAFVSDLQTILNRTLKVIHGKGNTYWHSTAMGAETDRALGLLGIEYTVESDGDIKITNAQKLIEGLKKYKTDGLELMKRKIGETNLTEELSAAAKKEIESSLKPRFEANPLEFIYRNAGLDFQNSSGIKPRTMVPVLFEANGFSGLEFAGAEDQATYMQGNSMTRRTLAQLAKMMSESNPTLLATWRAMNPDLYNRWALEITDKEVRDKADSGNLSNAEINTLAAKYNLQPVNIIDRIFALRPSWKKEAVNDFKAAGSPAGRREEIIRATLQRLQGRTVSSPIRRRTSLPGTPVGEPRASRASIGPEVARGRGPDASITSVEDVPGNAKQLLELLRAAKTATSKRSSSARKKSTAKKRK